MVSKLDIVLALAWLLVGILPIHGLFWFGIRTERERNARIVRVIRETISKRTGRRQSRPVYKTLGNRR